MRIRTHTNPLTFKNHHPKLILENCFKTPSNPLDVEVGFGRGIFLRQFAHNHKDRNIIGIEVRKSIVDEMEIKIKEENLTNVHLINSSALLVLKEGVDNEILENIFIFHPDPWFKKRHHKRRVITKDFLNICAQKLKKEGQIHISTDVSELWDYMLEEINTHGIFQNHQNDIFWEKEYKTHWAKFSKEDNREFFYSSFKKR